MTASLKPEQSSVCRLANLTSREGEVGTLVAQGFTNHQIASELSISEHTVVTHVAKILNELEVNSRSQLATWISGR